MRKLQYCTAIQIKFGTRKLNPSNQRNKKSNLERKENIKGIELVKSQNKNQVYMGWPNPSLIMRRGKVKAKHLHADYF